MSSCDTLTDTKIDDLVYRIHTSVQKDLLRSPVFGPILAVLRLIRAIKKAPWQMIHGAKKEEEEGYVPSSLSSTPSLSSAA